MNWQVPPPCWDTFAGRMLDAFFTRVQQQMPGFEGPLTVFGSAPIQLCVDGDFVSADADVMVLSHAAELRQIAADVVPSKTGPGVMHGVQVCPADWFRTTPHYLARAHMETRNGLRIIVPHLRDVLIGKLHRARVEGQEGLVPKDLRAFARVRQLCGGRPAEQDLLDDLRACEAYFRPPPAGQIHSFKLNTLDLWRQLFGRDLDVEGEIVSPVIQEEAEIYKAFRRVDDLLEGLRPERD